MRLALALALALLSSAAAAQVGTCGPGKDCVVSTLRVTKQKAAAGGGNFILRLPAGGSNTISYCDAASNCNYLYVSQSSSAGWLITNGAGGNSLTAMQSVDVNGGVAGIYNSGTNAPLRMSDTQGLLFSGVATGSLATCAAGLNGTVQYDTTTTSFKWCDGTAWREFHTYGVTVANVTAAQSLNWYSGSQGTGVASEDVNFIGSHRAQRTYGKADITCAFGAPGVTGAATTGVVVKLWDETGAASVGTCDMGAASVCATAAGVGVACTVTGTITSGNIYTMRLDATTDCDTDPSEIRCNVTFKE